MNIPSLTEAYSAIEGRLSPQLDDLVRSDGFAHASALISNAQSAIGDTLDAINAHVLHAFNLPAGTDVKRLRRQIGDLDHEVRTLRMEIARWLEEHASEH